MTKECVVINDCSLVLEVKESYILSYYLKNLIINGVSCVFLHRRLHFTVFVWKHVEFHISTEENKHNKDTELEK